MTTRRLAIFVACYFLLSTGHMLLVAPQAEATGHCCRNCYNGLPKSCAACPCLLRALAEPVSVTSADTGYDITLSGKDNNRIRVEASPDVLNKIVDIRGKGKPAYGYYLVQPSDNDDNPKSKCVGFAEVDAVEDDLPIVLELDHGLKLEQPAVASPILK